MNFAVPGLASSLMTSLRFARVARLVCGRRPERFGVVGDQCGVVGGRALRSARTGSPFHASPSTRPVMTSSVLRTDRASAERYPGARDERHQNSCDRPVAGSGPCAEREQRTFRRGSIGRRSRR